MLTKMHNSDIMSKLILVVYGCFTGMVNMINQAVSIGK